MTLFRSALLLAALLIAPLASAQDDKVVPLETYDVSGLNEGLVNGKLTCDLHFHLTKKGSVTWEAILQQLPKLHKIFEPTGVQMRIASARLVEIPEAWHTVKPDKGPAPSSDRTSFYAKYSETTRLAPATEHTFNAVIGPNGPGAELSVHFISLRKVDIGWWEQDDDGEWKFATSGTSACSFPPYMYADRIPARVRGAITLSGGSSARTLAHELGHKLINVSHEGVGRGPRGEQWGGKDLMIYGTGTRIPSGEEGRFQLQRLQKSPFLYRLVGADREYNAPYREGGHYWDPIYDGLWAETPPKREADQAEGDGETEADAEGEAPRRRSGLTDGVPGGNRGPR